MLELEAQVDQEAMNKVVPIVEIETMQEISPTRELKLHRKGVTTKIKRISR